MATKMVSLRVDEGLLEWLDAFAEGEGSSRTSVVDRAVRAFRAGREMTGLEYESASPSPAAASTRDGRSRVRPNVPGVMTARELVMRQRQERVNRGGS